MFIANMLLRSGALVAMISFPLFLTACASAPPKEALSKAEAAIADADRAEAAKYEPELLSSARTKLDRAKKDVANEENEDARRMADEARAEAVLAGAKTEALKQDKQVNEMQKAIEALKQETSREAEGQ